MQATKNYLVIIVILSLSLNVIVLLLRATSSTYHFIYLFLPLLDNSMYNANLLLLSLLEKGIKYQRETLSMTRNQDKSVLCNVNALKVILIQK